MAATTPGTWRWAWPIASSGRSDPSGELSTRVTIVVQMAILKTAPAMGGGAQAAACLAGQPVRMARRTEQGMPLRMAQRAA